jgi:hypothetical protein
MSAMTSFLLGFAVRAQGHDGRMPDARPFRAIGPTGRRTGLALPSVIALSAALVLGACSASPSSEKESRDAGRDYGQTIMDTLGSRTNQAEREELCGQGLVDGKIVDPETGRPGDETDLEVDAFIAGCREAVAD